MDYAIIKLGNKQHRVRDGETLVVDRLPTEEGKSFEPVVLLGETKVTATVVAHERGPKILIGKYRKRTGYKRHNGFRAATSRVEITLGAGTKRAAAKAEKPPKAAKAEAPAPEPAEAASGGRMPEESSAPGRVRVDDGRAGQGGDEGMERRGSAGGPRVREGARGPEGRGRRARVGARAGRGRGGEQ